MMAGEETSPLMPHNVRDVSTTNQGLSVAMADGPRREALPAIQDDIGGRSFGRFRLLLLFCCLAFIQNSIFGEWNTVQNSTTYAFYPVWSASTFAWQSNLATITSPISQLPIWWAVEKFGLSHTIQWVGVFPIFASSALSCLPLLVPSLSAWSYVWFTYAAYVLTGITGVVFFSCITKFSRVWFPPEQRATSTGMLLTVGSMGSLLPAVVGPQMITEPPNGTALSTDERMEIRTEIFHYLLIYFIFTGLLFVAFLFFFPSESTSAFAMPNQSNRNTNEEAMSPMKMVLKNFRNILRRPHAVMIVVLQSLSSLPFFWAMSLLNVTLKPLGVSQKSTGILVITTTGVSFIFTLFVSRVADLYFRFRLKTLLLLLLPVHSVCMIGLGTVSLLSDSESLETRYLFFVFYVAGMSVLISSSPLLYELAAEMSYPVPEDVVGGLCHQSTNILGSIFYVAFSEFTGYYGEDYSWLHYTLMFLPSSVTILLVFVKVRYRRSEATTTLNREGLFITLPPSTFDAIGTDSNAVSPTES